jgi:site-specific recombinase XerC
MAYALAERQFFNWCEQRGLELDAIRPRIVAAYIEQLGAGMAKPSVKQHLAAIRQLFDYLVTGGILPSNPAGAVRGPKYVVKRGKTPVLSAEQARQLLDSIDVTELSGLRDRALIGVMVYSFARVSAAAALRVEDYFEHGKRAWLRLHEKGGKRHEVPCHHNLAAYMDAWIDAAGIVVDKKGPLFRSIRLDRSRRNRWRQERLAVPQHSQRQQSHHQPDGHERRTPDDQAASEGRQPALLHVLPHLPCDRHHHLPKKWRHARACPTDCGT